jgi:hypothetical protein
LKIDEKPKTTLFWGFRVTKMPSLKEKKINKKTPLNAVISISIKKKKPFFSSSGGSPLSSSHGLMNKAN